MSFERIHTEEWETKPFFLPKQKLLLTAEGRAGEINPMTVSWGGFSVLWGMPVLMVAVREERYTKKLLTEGKRFSLSSLDDGEEALSFCGSHSGKIENKVQGAALAPLAFSEGWGYTASREIVMAEKLAAVPLQKEFLLDPALFSWYQKESFHTLYFGKVTAIYRKH